MCNTASRSCVIAPVERRFVELEPTEWEDAGKRVARFVVTREALGVPAGWVYRVDSLHLVVDGQKWHDAGGGMRLPLRCVLEWVEAPDGDAAAAAARVSGLAIEALLSATGAMPLMTEPYGGAVRFAVYLPFGPHAAGVPLRVRAGLAAGGSGVHLVAAIFVAPRGPEGRRVCEFEWNRLFSAPLRIEAGDAAAAGEALVPLDLPSVVTDLLLQAVVVALPFRQIRVHDVALLLDGRELACAPGIAARV